VLQVEVLERLELADERGHGAEVAGVQSQVAERGQTSQRRREPGDFVVVVAGVNVVAFVVKVVMRFSTLVAPEFERCQPLERSQFLRQRTKETNDERAGGEKK